MQEEVDNIQKKGCISWTADVISIGCSYCKDICRRDFFTNIGKKMSIISEQSFMKWVEKALIREMKIIFPDQDVHIFIAASIKVLAVYVLLEMVPQDIGLFAFYAYGIAQIIKRDSGITIGDKNGEVPINRAIILKALKEWVLFLSPSNLTSFSIDSAKVLFLSTCAGIIAREILKNSLTVSEQDPIRQTSYQGNKK